MFRVVYVTTVLLLVFSRPCLAERYVYLSLSGENRIGRFAVDPESGKLARREAGLHRTQRERRDPLSRFDGPLGIGPYRVRDNHGPL